MTDKTFFLGVGAQKSGTTWVNHFVRGDPAGFSLKNEFHVWDALYVPECSGFVATRSNPLLRLYFTLRRLVGRKDLIRDLRYRFQQDPDSYFDYFEAALERPGCRVAADITPSYATLPVEALTRIRDGFARRGIPVKVLFIMRDPVERCWSAVRMSKAKAVLPGDVSDDEALKARYRSSEVQLRTRYHDTMDRLEQVFAPESLHYAIYETLFTPSEMDRFAAFVGLAPDHSALQKRVNRTPKTGSISPEITAEVARFYADVYKACDARFGNIERVWPNAALALR